MCLIFLSFRNHPTYKLVVAANRDEFYERQTEAAKFWDDKPQILAGRDLVANGTWMGMTTSGKISLLTNYRDPKNIDPHAPSRGLLVSDYLEGRNRPENYLRAVDEGDAEYNGFNIITGSVNELWYYSNYSHVIEELMPGFYGLSNHLLDTPWPKIVRGKEKLKSIIAQPVIQPEQLLDAMYDEVLAPEDKLPDTGLSPEREKALSSMFIKTPNYGTRCSTVVLVDYDNEVTFVERVYDVKTFQHTTGTFQFKV
ncbi:NRDE family protein [Chryseolinea lacunae]|uniref:NRDE family protein n=1 Tax=Chryseolinea lacunae TaxID=2801331 RepID=A0ABS1L0K7_9BACT|nr:NRDE family protein [Chryseolinea lacunae]MBL0745052.1 NRDE family protein [Chryseolinea lacunae]